MPTTPPTNANGARRRALVRRVLAEEHTCALCDKPIDKSLSFDWGRHSKRCKDPKCKGCVPHPDRAEVDEDIPRSRGGSPYERRNTHAMHRHCNQYKSDMTLAEARAKLHAAPSEPAGPTPVTCSPIW